MDNLYQIAEDENICIYERNFRGRTKGLYIDNSIALKRGMTMIDTRCNLGEELGHHFTTVGDITDQTKIENRKQERQARGWGYRKLVSIDEIAEAVSYKVQSLCELAEYLNVPDEYLSEAINYYKEKYGLYYKCSDYVLCFNPMYIIRNRANY